MDSVCPEIITVQIGHYSNFIGTHWWNIQESSFIYNPAAKVEVEHGVLFREGETPKGEATFTPRLLVAELRGSLGGLRRRGRLYGAELLPSGKQEAGLWQGDTERHQQEPLPPAPPRSRRYSGDADTTIEEDGEKDVCQADERAGEDGSGDGCPVAAEGERREVRVWSDLLRTHLHPWSIHLLSEPAHGSADEPFDVFNLGETQYQREDFRDGFEDRLRAYAEECDRLVGFHVLADGGDGFGGVAAGALSHVADEYPRRPVLLLPVQPYPASALTLPQAVHQTVNTLLTLDTGAEHAALCSPLSVQADWTAPLRAPSCRTLENFCYKPELAEQSSALLAAALDTITLPWRRKRSPLPLGEVADVLSAHGRRLAGLSTALPLGIAPGDNTTTWLGADNLKLTNLTPGVSDETVQIWNSCGVLRGASDRIAGSGVEPWAAALGARCGLSLPLAVRLQEPLRTPSPLGDLFPPSVDRTGRLRAHTVNSQGVESAPVAAALETSVGLGRSLAALHATADRFNVNKFHRFAAAGLQSDDFAEAMERLSCLVHCYEPDT